MNFDLFQLKASSLNEKKDCSFRHQNKIFNNLVVENVNFIFQLSVAEHPLRDPNLRRRACSNHIFCYIKRNT
jgi:hypothetical protein